jgi:hypothetical protein
LVISRIADAQQFQHPRRHREIARLGRQAEPVVGIDRIEALVLQLDRRAAC